MRGEERGTHLESVVNNVTSRLILDVQLPGLAEVLGATITGKQRPVYSSGKSRPIDVTMAGVLLQCLILGTLANPAGILAAIILGGPAMLDCALDSMVGGGQEGEHCRQLCRSLGATVSYSPVPEERPGVCADGAGSLNLVLVPALVMMAMMAVVVTFFLDLVVVDIDEAGDAVRAARSLGA